MTRIFNCIFEIQVICDPNHVMYPIEILVGKEGKISDPCHFPIITDGVNQNKAETHQYRRVTPIDIGQYGDGNELRDFSLKHNIDLPTLFQLTWAIVLATYIGTKHVSFIVVKNQEDKREVGLWEAELDNGMNLIDVLLQSQENTSKSYVKFSEQSPQIPIAANVNSVVVFQNSSQQSFEVC